MGLKDQQLAIAWVHKNIGVFGGDPEKITLAGGAAASYHLVNSRSSSKFLKSLNVAINEY